MPKAQRPVVFDPAAITLYRANSFNASSLHHGFCGRTGGVSVGPHSSLACSSKNGQVPPAQVKENRRRAVFAVTKGVHQAVMGLNQQHTAICHLVTKPYPQGEPKQIGDAFVTKVPGLMLGIITADCVPVLFYDQAAGVVGAAHAGWRGAVGGILEETLRTMALQGAKAANIQVAIGPCIRQTSYEVGQDVYEEVIAATPNPSPLFKALPKPGKWLFDLPGYVAQRLQQAGVLANNIEDLGIDTYSAPKAFFSCRRSFHKMETNFGVQLSVIGLGRS